MTVVMVMVALGDGDDGDGGDGDLDDGDGGDLDDGDGGCDDH